MGVVAREETRGLRPAVLLSSAVARLLPDGSAFRIRGVVLRCAGFRIDRTAHFAGMPTWSGSGPIRDRLDVGPDCWINVGCHIELSDTVRIERGVSIGHDVLILTSTHQIGSEPRRAAGLTTGPVVIGAGAWIGARSVILPGVTVGESSIVGAGSVVTKDVPPNRVVGGVPACIRRELSD